MTNLAVLLQQAKEKENGVKKTEHVTPGNSGLRYVTVTGMTCSVISPLKRSF